MQIFVKMMNSKVQIEKAKIDFESTIFIKALKMYCESIDAKRHNTKIR